MQKLKSLLALALFGALSSGLIAQHHHPHPYPCGVSLDDGLLIEQRLLENRLRYPQILGFQTRNVRYLPIAFRMVADANGQGRIDVDDVLANLCDINADYADQNIQFYFRDSLRHLNNQNIYNDATSFNAMSFMTTNRVAPTTTINVYISPSVNNAAASYYFPTGDFIFVINSEMNGRSNTLTHELGHFFSLNHTFFGWEGTDVESRYPNNAPNSIGGRAVERVDGSNCAQAADRFCDTPADYYSTREPCPYNGTAKDPTGLAITPDVSNYMSYFFDVCVTRFSTEQKAAINADVQRRGWNAAAAPAVIGFPDATAIQGQPQNGLVVGTGPSGNGNDSLTLSWNAVPEATAYVLRFERVLFGVSLGSVFKTIVYGSNQYRLATADLPFATSDYRWSVKPINSYQTCTDYSAWFTFRASANVPFSPPTSLDLSQELDWTIRLMEQPLRQATAQMELNLPQTAELGFVLYSLEGRILMQQAPQLLEAGQHRLNLDLSHLSNGFYLLQAYGPQGQQSLKLQILR